MAQYCTRVELHGATTAAEYDQLHKAMERGAFSRTAAGFHLPTAEYWLVSNLDANQVRDKARAIANAVRPNASVLVVEVANWAAWLTPVRKAG